MDMNKTHEPEFRTAAERRTHELSRLNTEQREQLQQQVEAIKERADKEMRVAGEKQQTGHDSAIARAMKDIREERNQANYRPWWARDRLNETRVRELAERKVEAENKQALALISARTKQGVERCIDDFLAAVPEFQRERESVDLMKARWSEARDATRYGGHEDTPGRDQDPRDRGRGR